MSKIVSQVGCRQSFLLKGSNTSLVLDLFAGMSAVLLWSTTMKVALSLAPLAFFANSLILVLRKQCRYRCLLCWSAPARPVLQLPRSPDPRCPQAQPVLPVPRLGKTIIFACLNGFWMTSCCLPRWTPWTCCWVALAPPCGSFPPCSSSSPYHPATSILHMGQDRYLVT
jgi:hypothetical protein